MGVVAAVRAKVVVVSVVVVNICDEWILVHRPGEVDVRSGGFVTLCFGRRTHHRDGSERLNRKAQCKQQDEDEFAPVGHGRSLAWAGGVSGGSLAVGPDGVAGEGMGRGRFLTGHGLAGERGSEGIGLEQMDQLFGAPAGIGSAAPACGSFTGAHRPLWNQCLARLAIC